MCFFRIKQRLNFQDFTESLNNALYIEKIALTFILCPMLWDGCAGSGDGHAGVFALSLSKSMTNFKQTNVMVFSATVVD